MYLIIIISAVAVITSGVFNYVHALKNNNVLLPKIIFALSRRAAFRSAASVLLAYVIMYFVSPDTALVLARPATALIPAVIVVIDAAITLFWTVFIFIKYKVSLRSNLIIRYVRDFIYIAASVFCLIAISSF